MDYLQGTYILSDPVASIYNSYYLRLIELNLVKSYFLEFLCHQEYEPSKKVQRERGNTIFDHSSKMNIKANTTISTAMKDACVAQK